LQAHCQSPTSCRFIQSFVKELAKPAQRQKTCIENERKLILNKNGQLPTMNELTINKHRFNTENEVQVKPALRLY